MNHAMQRWFIGIFVGMLLLVGLSTNATDITVNYQRTTRVFHVAQLQLTSYGVGSVPLFSLLCNSPLKPDGWQLDNPLATGGITDKNNSAYWVVPLSDINVTTLAAFDLLVVNDLGKARLNNNDKANLRKLLDLGATIWFNGGDALDTQLVQTTNDFIDPPIVFNNILVDPDGRNLLAADAAHWLLRGKFTISDDELNSLRSHGSYRTALVPTVALRAVVTTQGPALDPTQKTQLSVVAVGQISRGTVIVTAENVIGAIADWSGTDPTKYPQGDSYTLALPPNSNRSYLAGVKFAYNMLGRPVNWAAVGGPAGAVRAVNAAYPPALARAWTDTFTATCDPVAAGAYLALTGNTTGMELPAELRVYRVKRLLDDAGDAQDYPYGLSDENGQIINKTTLTPRPVGFPEDAVNGSEQDLCFSLTSTTGWIGSPVFGEVKSAIGSTSITRTVIYALENKDINTATLHCIALDPYIRNTVGTAQIATDIFTKDVPLSNGLCRASLTRNGNVLVITLFGVAKTPADQRILIYDAQTGARRASLGTVPGKITNYTCPASIVAGNIEFDATDREVGIYGGGDPDVKRRRQDMVDMLAVTSENVVANASGTPTAAVTLIPPMAVVTTTDNFNSIPDDLRLIDGAGNTYYLGDVSKAPNVTTKNQSAIFRKNHVLSVMASGNTIKIIFKHWGIFCNPDGEGTPVLEMPCTLSYSLGGGKRVFDVNQLMPGYSIMLGGSMRSFNMFDATGASTHSTIQLLDGDLTLDGTGKLKTGSSYGYTANSPLLYYRDMVIGATNYTEKSGNAGALMGLRLRHPGFNDASVPAGASLYQQYSGKGEIKDIWSDSWAFIFYGDLLGAKSTINNPLIAYPWRGDSHIQWFSNFPFPAAAKGESIYTIGTYYNGRYDSVPFTEANFPTTNRSTLYSLTPTPDRYLHQTVTAGWVDPMAALNADLKVLTITASPLTGALRVGARAILKINGTTPPTTWDMGNIVSITGNGPYTVTFDRPRAATLDITQTSLLVNTSSPYLSHVQVWNAVTGAEPVRNYKSDNLLTAPLALGGTTLAVDNPSSFAINEEITLTDLVTRHVMALPVKVTGIDPAAKTVTIDTGADQAYPAGAHISHTWDAVRISEGICVTPPKGKSADPNTPDQEVTISAFGLEKTCHEPDSIDSTTKTVKIFDQDMSAIIPPANTLPRLDMNAVNFQVDHRNGRIELSPMNSGSFADRFFAVHYYTNDIVNGVATKVLHSEVMYVPTQIKWQYNFTDAIPDSGPVVVGDTIYVTVQQSIKDAQMRPVLWRPAVYAFATAPRDPFNVQPLWIRPLNSSIPYTPLSPYRGATTPVPTSTGLVIGTALPGLVNNELVSFADRGTLVSDGQRLLRYNGAGMLTWAAFATQGRDPGLMGPVAPTTDEDTGTAVESFNLLTRVRRLPSGNLLLCDTGSSRVVEMDRAGNIVWQYPDSDLTFQDQDKDSANRPIRSVNSGGALSYFDVRQPTTSYYRLTTPRDVRRYAYNSPVADPAKVQVFWRRPSGAAAFCLEDGKWYTSSGPKSSYVVDSLLALDGISPFVQAADTPATSPMLVNTRAERMALSTSDGKVAYQTDENKWYAYLPMPTPQPAQWQQQQVIRTVDNIGVLLALPDNMITVGDTFYCNARRARYTLLAKPASRMDNWRAQPVVPFLASQAEMLAQTGLQSADRVYRTDANQWYIYIGGNPADILNWTTSATKTVATEAAMLALIPSASVGTMVKRSDVNLSYTLVALPATFAENWEVQQIIPAISTQAAMTKPVITLVGGRVYRTDEHRFYTLTALPATNIANWHTEKLLLMLTSAPIPAGELPPVAVVSDSVPAPMLGWVATAAGLTGSYLDRIGDMAYAVDSGKWYQLIGYPNTDITNWQVVNYYSTSATAITAAVDGDRAYRTDLKKWYLRQGGAWVPSTPLLAVGSRAAMLSYTTAQVGDYVYRNDTADWYILNALPATAAVNWVRTTAPTVPTPLLLPTIAVPAAINNMPAPGDIDLTPYKAVMRWESTLIADTGNHRIMEVNRPLLKLEDTDKFNSDKNMNFARGFQYRPDCYYQYIDMVTTTWSAEKPLVQGVDEIVGGATELDLVRIPVTTPLAYTVAMRYRGIDNRLEDTYQPKATEASYNDPAAQSHSRELLVALGNTVTLTETGNTAQTARTLRISRPRPMMVPAAPSVIRNFSSLTAPAALGDNVLQLDVSQEYKVGEQIDVTDNARTVVFKTTIVALDTTANKITLAAVLPRAFVTGDKVWHHRINALEPRPNTSDFAHIQQLDLVTLRNGMSEEVHALVVDAQGVREIVMDPSRLLNEAPIFEMNQQSYLDALGQFKMQVNSNSNALLNLRAAQLAVGEKAVVKAAALDWAKDNMFLPQAVVRQDSGNGTVDTDHHVRYLISQMNSIARRMHLFEARWSNVFGNGYGIMDDGLDYFIFPDPLTLNYPSLPGGSYPLTQPLALAND